jgi:hypothetical protein
MQPANVTADRHETTKAGRVYGPRRPAMRHTRLSSSAIIKKPVEI